MRFILGISMCLAIAASFALNPIDTFLNPQLARILCIHLPCAIATPFFLVFGSYLSYRYIKSGDMLWDIRATAANSVGFVLSLLTMSTGIIFSYVQWGAWWQWDPRQTSFLLLLLIYAAMFALRSAYSDPIFKAKNTAAYSCIAIIPAFFLIFVVPRLPQLNSFHPSNTVVSGGLNNIYGLIVSVLLVLVTWLCGWIYQITVRAGRVDLRVQELYANMANMGLNTGAAGVVRPLSLSEDGGKSGVVG